MKTITTCCLSVIASCCAFAATACETPSMIAIPDGKTATKEGLMSAQGEVKAYMASMNDFLACVDKEMEAKGEAAPSDYKALMVSRHNAAVTEMESVAAAFNVQIKAWKAANPN